jgi:hemoglobin
MTPHAVGPVVRDEWMLCMRQALTEQVADEVLRTRLVETFSQMASHLLNTNAHRGCAALGLDPSQEAGTP